MDDSPSSVLRNPNEDSFLGGAVVEGLYYVGLVYVGSLVASVSAIIEEPVKGSGCKLNVSFHSARVKRTRTLPSIGLSSPFQQKSA